MNLKPFRNPFRHRHLWGSVLEANLDKALKYGVFSVEVSQCVKCGEYISW